MDQSTPTMDHYAAEFTRITPQFPGGETVSAQRQIAFTNFKGLGLPTPRLEDWKYTDLKKMAAKAFEIADTAGDINAAQLAEHLPKDFDSYRVVIIDGHFSAEHSNLEGLPKGAQIGSFADYLNNNDDAVIRHPDITEDGYSPRDMNAAFVTDGLYVNLAANTVVDKPVHLVIAASGAQPLTMSQVRNRLVLGTNSQIDLVEHHIGLGDETYLSNTVTEVINGENSQLTRYRLQQESTKGYHISASFSKQHRDSRFHNYSYDLGGKVARIDTNSYQCEPGADAQYIGVYQPTGKQHIDNHTRVDHDTEHGTSNEEFKGIIDDRGRGVFNGKVVVHKYAQHTDSNQQTDALQLSDKGRVDAKPELEIYADDVKCAHGSTIGQLDESAVFYMRTRGLSDTSARAVLTYGFAREVVTKIPFEPLLRFVEDAVLAKLPGNITFN